MTDPVLVLATFGVALVGGLVPLVNVEVYLVGVAVAIPGASVLPLVLAAGLGQMLAKIVLYGVGLGVVRVSTRRGALERVVARLAGGGAGARTVVFASALVGVPPFYAVSVAAGTLRLGLPSFVALGFCGRILRFAAILLTVSSGARR